MTFWDRVAGAYDLVERMNRRAVREMVSQVVRRVPSGSFFLECAAGTGEISLAVSGKADRVLCTDQSVKMLKRAQAKAAKRNITNIAFAQWDLLDLPEKEHAFDAVCAANVLHLLEDPKGAVMELWRVTKPGGLLLFPTFLTGEAGVLMRSCIAAYRRLGFEPKQDFTAASYRNFFKAPVAEFMVIRGRLPVGLAVLRKP